MELPGIATLRPLADDEASIRDAIARATEAGDLAQRNAEQLERDRAAGMLTDATGAELLDMERGAAELRLYVERVALLLPALNEALAGALRRDRIARINILRRQHKAEVDAWLQPFKNGEAQAAVALLVRLDNEARDLERKLVDARRGLDRLAPQPGELELEALWPRWALGDDILTVGNFPLKLPNFETLHRIAQLNRVDRQGNERQAADAAALAAARKAQPEGAAGRR